MADVNVQAEVTMIEPERTGSERILEIPFLAEILEKRLAAFETIAIVMTIFSGAAMETCFELPNEFRLLGPCYIVILAFFIGFLSMVLVMFMAVTATAVMALQLFFTIRLGTAGPLGFDKAKKFYEDKRMWLWRERAILFVKCSMIGFIWSSGYILLVKFWTYGVADKAAEKDAASIRQYQKVFSFFVFFIFAILSCQLVLQVRLHQKVFDECCKLADVCDVAQLRSPFMSVVDEP